MPIQFQCECGKKMTAKEEYAGRRLRCPECNRVVTIPKTGLAVAAPAKAAPGVPPKTLTRSEVLAITQQTETPAPSNTEAAGEPDFASMFGSGPSAPPPTRKPPLAAPVVKPAMAVAPVAAASPIVGEPVRTVHPWVDQSLTQMATPWRPGDEDRYQTGIRPAREWEFPLAWLFLFAGIVGCVAVLTIA